MAKITKRNDSFVFLQITKGVVIFIFIAGILSSTQLQGLENMTPIHESAKDEIVVDKTKDKSTLVGIQPFLTAKLLNSVNAPTPKDNNEPAVGGAVDTTFPTIQGSTFLAANILVIPEIPPQERAEIIEYVVKPGDTASTIASSFGLKLDTLLWSNELPSPNYIKPGQELFILPIDGVLYEVKSGDVLSGIAKKYKAEINDILEASGIESEGHIVEGQILIIPGGIKPAPKPRYRAPVSKYASSFVNLDNYFIRPTVGRISQGLHRTNAVDIAGGCWRPIYAAASGSVGIAIGNGRWNGGYGNYVTISHPNGTKTLYAHMIKTAVSSGQWVTKGQVIGYTGSTGRSTGCHVHWEVRGARNPMAY